MKISRGQRAARVTSKPLVASRRLLWLIPATAAALVFLSAASDTSAYPGSSTSGFRSATIQETDYDWPVWEGSQGYTNHLDRYFRLYIKQEEGRLRVHLPDVPEVALSTISGYGNVYPISFKKLEYNTVTHPDSCSLDFFYDNYDHALKYEAGVHNYLPLHSSDYGRYHCFLVTLNVDRPIPRFDPQPRRVFVAKQPVAAESISNDLGQFPGFTQAVMQNTHYDYSGPLLTDTPEFRSKYYAHLDDNFNLYYNRRANGRFDFRLRQPAGLTVPRGRDIRPFELERFDYTVVSQSSECARPAFEETTESRTPHSSLSLTSASADTGLYYCLKIGIKSTIPGRSDPEPYRIFFIPQAIISLETIPTTATNRHKARLSNY